MARTKTHIHRTVQLISRNQTHTFRKSLGCSGFSILLFIYDFLNDVFKINTEYYMTTT